MFSLKINILGDGSGFARTLDGLRSRAAGFGGELNSSLKSKLAAGFTVGAIAAVARANLQFASNISDLSKRLQVSTDKLQEWDYAAKLSGATIYDFASAFKALAAARDEALNKPASEPGRLFRVLGINEAELRNSPLERLFERIAEIIRTVDFGADELTIVNGLLGRAAGSLVPAFKDGLAKSAAEAHRLGLILEDEVVKALDDAGDALDRMEAAFTRGMARPLAWILEFLKGVVDLLEIGAKNAGAFFGGFQSGWKNSNAPQPNTTPNTPQAWAAARAARQQRVEAALPYEPVNSIGSVWRNLQTWRKRNTAGLMEYLKERWQPGTQIGRGLVSLEPWKEGLRQGIESLLGQHNETMDGFIRRGEYGAGAPGSGVGGSPETDGRTVRSLPRNETASEDTTKILREEERLRDKLFKHELSLLSVTERRAKLEAALREEMTAAEFIPDRELQLKHVERMLELAEELKSIKPEHIEVPTDSLSRIGGFTGTGAAAQSDSVAQKITETNQRLREFGDTQKALLQRVDRIASVVLDPS